MAFEKRVWRAGPGSGVNNAKLRGNSMADKEVKELSPEKKRAIEFVRILEHMMDIWSTKKDILDEFAASKASHIAELSPFSLEQSDDDDIRDFYGHLIDYKVASSKSELLEEILEFVKGKSNLIIHQSSIKRAEIDGVITCP